MKIIEGIENIDDQYENLCVALGTFDGVHPGHREVIGAAVSRAGEINGSSMVFTFSPHPLKIITSSTGPKLINSKEEKNILIDKLGVDVLLFANFTVEFSEIHPQEFVSKILVEMLNVKELFVGFNYTFGKGGIGNTEFLKDLCDKFGIKLTVVNPVKIDNKIVSSTLIRKQVTKGNLREASRLLGYNYTIIGKVVKGRRLGRKIGFPTANLKIVNKVYPPYGVYGVKLKIENDEKEYHGVMNIGENPTLKPGEHSIEVHILDFSKDIYNKKIFVEVIEFIRDEKKFDKVEDLIEAIREDLVLWREKISLE